MPQKSFLDKMRDDKPNTPETSLLDDLRKVFASKTIEKETARKGNFRSCEQCSFCKNGYCTQVQPPSKILNVYEAQICIYYTPETTTTGQITQTERATQASQLDLIKRINLIDLITHIVTIDTIASITNIANLQSVDLIDRITLIDNITNLGTLNLLNTVNLIKSISSIDAITNIVNLQSIDLIDEITKIDEITQVKDIKTVGGINLVIDKLTQNAYIEDRRTLSNNGATPSMSICGTTARGKFFPRGCRGFINTLQIYCDNLDASNPHTLTIKISCLIGFGEVITKTLVLSANTSAAWQTVDIKSMWNYDSMFIWVQSDSNTYGRVGNDSGTPYDYYYSSDGITWTVASARYWFKLSMVGETVGDLPVSGTINTIDIPSVASINSVEGVTVQPSTLTSITIIYGVGEMLEAKLQFATTAVPSNDIFFRLCFYVDGATTPYMIDNRDLVQSATATSGRASNGEFFKHDNLCHMNVRMPLQFKKKLEIKFFQTTSSSVLGNITTAINML